MTMTEDDRTERTDSASLGESFLAWLADQKVLDPDEVGEFAPLYFMNGSRNGYGVKYTFDKYTAQLAKDIEDEEEREFLTELLLRAEAVWRVARTSRHRSRAALGLDVTTGLSPLPVTVVKCGHLNRAGTECGKDVVPGTPRCARHGGMLVDPETRRSILLSAYATLVEGSDTAVSTLIEVAEHGKSELARVTAAKEILDRVGLVPEMRISLTTDDSTVRDGLADLRKRLSDTRDRILLQPAAIDTTAVEVPVPTSQNETVIEPAVVEAVEATA